MLMLVLVSGAFAMPIRRSLDLGGFGDDAIVTTIPITTTSKTHRKYINFKIFCKLIYKGFWKFHAAKVFYR